VASAGSGSIQLAERYSTALFELSDEKKILDAVEADLIALKSVISESADLRVLLTSPLISAEDQIKAIESILAKAGANEVIRNLAGVVAQNHRLYLLPQIIDTFLAELARRRGELTADVATAKNLTKSQSSALEDALKQAVGSKVTISVSVDPSLIGGMIVKVGSRMIDSSVRTKLNKLQLAMKGVA
jgi:F-type H+-transporting ATPase subunit delta